MNCKDIDQLQHAFVDNELDPANAQAFAAHLATCPDCSRKLEELSVIRHEIKTHATRHALPRELFDKIAAMAGAQKSHVAAMPRKWQPIKWGASGAALAMAACLAFFMVVRPDNEYVVEQQLIASHIRSLQEGHLTDVVSTDQHTVKPWFNGRLDISPPVTDFSAQGFPLVGGRLDYIDHHTAAVIVYRANAHVINLFVWPSDGSALGEEFTALQQGYNMRHWHDGDLQFWAISDVNKEKLATFEKLYRGK